MARGDHEMWRRRLSKRQADLRERTRARDANRPQRPLHQQTDQLIAPLGEATWQPNRKEDHPFPMRISYRIPPRPQRPMTPTRQRAQHEPTAPGGSRIKAVLADCFGAGASFW